MKIVLLPASYPPVLGGLQTASHTLAQRLLRQGHAVLVVANRYPRALPAHEILDGVAVRRRLFLPPHFDDLRQRPELFLASLYCHPATLLALRRLWGSFQPEVVNVHYPDRQIPYVLWLRQWRPFRLVVSLHGAEIEHWPGSKPNKLPTLLRVADAVTACSRYLLDLAIQLEPSVAGKGHVIYNGIDIARFDDRTPYQHPRPYLLAFGRLTRQKGFDMLLEAFARVAPGVPGLDLILAGSGEDHAALLDQVHRLGLAGRAHLIGAATPEQVVQLLNGCRFAVVSSRYEAFGIVALEAMAAGKLVLATRVGGLAEFVDPANNLLVEPTVAGLAEGLQDALRRCDDVADSGAANRRRAAAYTWSQVVAQYLAIYGAEDNSRKEL